MRKVVWLLSIALLTFSCNNDSSSEIDATINASEGQVRSKLSSGTENAEELKAAAEERQKERERLEEERMASMTTMDISPKVHDFGSIPSGQPVTTVFTIKNTGDNPLIIDDAKASCGCTVPEKPEQPIMPGEEYPLEVTFTSNPGQAGTLVNKTVTVTANIAEASQVVNIKANVQP
ncbi:MAG: DUF1573 domain-containing protein [Brumimicrobium sp.]